MRKQVSTLIFLIAILFSCAEEENSMTPFVPEANDGKVFVSFGFDLNALAKTTKSKAETIQRTSTTMLNMEPGVWADVVPLSVDVEQVATKAIEPLSVDSTLRVVVYKRRPGGKTSNPALDQFIATNTYVVGPNQALVPTLVNSAGSAITGKASPMYLLNDTYDFYAYTPAIPLSSDSLVRVNNGYDFATTLAEQITIDEIKTHVMFPSLDRQMARIQFTIQPDQDNVEASSLKIGKLGMDLLQTTNAPYTLRLGNSIIATADTSDNHIIDASRFVQLLPNKVQCFDYILPKIKGALYLYFNLAVNGLDQTYIATLPNAVFEGGSNYIYNVMIRKKGVASVEQANCYMVLPGQTFTFPVAQSVNGGANLLKPWNASVYWESSSSFLTVKSIDKKNGTITITTNGTGNGLVALKQRGNICWSWHIWGTSYNPSLVTDFPAAENVISVNGGEVHRYDNEFFHTTNKVIMDRNLGALSVTPGNKNTYGMLYQWGRKDPFLPSGMRVVGQNTSVNGGPVALQTAIDNPTVFYYSGFLYYNWAIYPGQYWTDDEKTIFDPCPPGWRVPDDDVWEGFTQSNMTQSPSGAGSVYQPAQAYFPYSGQRNYEYGSFKNVGVAGYQWSSDESSGIIDFIDYAESFYYSKLGLNDAYDLPKASGLSVRCVQE